MADTQHIADLRAFKAKLVATRREIVRHEVDAINRGGDVLAESVQQMIEAARLALITRLDVEFAGERPPAPPIPSLNLSPEAESESVS